MHIPGVCICLIDSFVMVVSILLVSPDSPLSPPLCHSWVRVVAHDTPNPLWSAHRIRVKLPGGRLVNREPMLTVPSRDMSKALGEGTPGGLLLRGCKGGAGVVSY